MVPVLQEVAQKPDDTEADPASWGWTLHRQAGGLHSKFLILRVPFPPRYLLVVDELGCFARNLDLTVIILN